MHVFGPIPTPKSNHCHEGFDECAATYYPFSSRPYRRGCHWGGEGAAGDLRDLRAPLDLAWVTGVVVAELEARPVVRVRHLERPEGGGGAHVAAGRRQGGPEAVHDRSQDLEEPLPHRPIKALKFTRKWS